MITKNYNWLACIIYTITLLSLPCLANAERFEGHRGGGNRAMERPHFDQRHVNRPGGAVRHGGHNNAPMHHDNVPINHGHQGKYYHNGKHYNYYHNGKHYNYYHGGNYYNYQHNGRYYNYYHNGNYYNYFYNGAYYLYFINGAYFNYYYQGRYYKSCVKVAGNPTAMVCH